MKIKLNLTAQTTSLRAIAKQSPKQSMSLQSSGQRRSNLLQITMLLIIAATLLTTCRKDHGRIIDVQSQNVENIDASGAEAIATITDIGESGISAHGWCWASTANPTVENDKTDLGGRNSTYIFTTQIMGLDPGTTYYARPYASSGGQTVYGETTTINTQSLTFIIINPTENAVFAYGLTYSIVWQANISDKVKIELYKGTVLSLEIANNLENTGTYNWTVPESTEEGNNYKIVISSLSNSSITQESAIFIIDTKAMPTVTTDEVTDISYTTATCGGEVLQDNGFEVTARGVCWATTMNPTITDDNTENGTGTGTFTSSITGLVDNTTYYVRAYATNEAGTAYGAERTFTTLDATEATVTTAPVTDIGYNTATCGGEVTSEGTHAVTARGVCWATTTNPTITDDNTENGTGTGTFTSSITALADNTTYYVRAYATNSAGTAYGEGREFKTLDATEATVTTDEVTDISYTTATCGGEVTSEGTHTVTARGVCWATTTNPTITDDKTEDGSGTGSFTSSITALDDNTTYYMRAYATNEAGTAYGEERPFTTLELPANMFADYDGNVYNTVTIGNQIWMAENLKVTNYSDGTSIPLVTDNTAWGNLGNNNTDKAYCYYNNSDANRDTYGALYTYAAATNGDNDGVTQGVCPTGWHLPGDAEWTELVNYVSSDGHSGTEGTALKSTSGWNSGGNGTDDYGFSALPGGYRSSSDGSFSNVGDGGYWWSATEFSATSAWYRSLYYDHSDVYRGGSGKSIGFSVRCLRD